MNAHFIGELLLDPLKDGRNFAVARIFGMWTTLLGLISIPRGFVTDLASIPRIFWNILPPFGKYTKIAVVHDYLYRTHLCSRYQADRVLREGMIICGVPLWQRVVIYWAVRLFGGRAYADDARRISFLKPQPTHDHV